MVDSKEVLLQKVLRGYAGYFNIKEQVTIDGLPVAAEAEFHSRDEKYVLTKSAQLWAALLLAPVGGSRAPTCGSRRPEW